MTRSPRWRGALASAAVLVAASLAAAQTAHAQSAGPCPPPYPPPPHCLELTATTVHAGGRLGFRGAGFAPQQRVEADLKSFAVVLGTFKSDEHGDVTGTVTIPRGTRSGSHTFELIAREPHRKCAVKIKVRHDGRPGRHDGQPGRDDGRPGRHDGQPGRHDEPGRYDEPGRDDGRPGRHDGQPGRASLANAGGGTALALGGAAAGLIAAGGGTLLAVRRRRSS